MHYYTCPFGNQAWEVNSSRSESTDMPGLGMESQQGVTGSEVETDLSRIHQQGSTEL